MMKLRYLIIILLPLMSLNAARHEFGASLLLGNHARYGGEFKSVNHPNGIWGLNSSSTGTTGTADFSQMNGIASEIQLKYIFDRKYFFTLGGIYTAGLKSTGTFPLRNPVSGSLTTLSGDEIPVTGSASLTHYGVPINFGLVMSFWNEVRIYLGPGVSYMFTEQSVSVVSADDSTDFEIKHEISPSFLVYHALLMGEYIVIGSSEDKNKLAINAGVQVYRGQSASTADSKVESDVTLGDTNQTTFLGHDAGRVDLSGYRVFIGVTYYFYRG